MQKIEEITLSKLILDEDYCRKTLPFIQDEYFESIHHRTIFDTVRLYVEEYNAVPEPTAIKIEVEKRRDRSHGVYILCK